MRIFFSVGEPSGDEHTAGLIRALRARRPDCHCVGFGGDDMQAAGCEILFPLTTMAVMGIMQVLPLIRKFWNVGQMAKRYFREHRPDAVVLVDFPGFNWWIAYYAKQQGIPVYYYMPPQLWAWGPWRIWRIRKYVDHVLSGLTFETEWYQQRGINAQFVGHPFFEEVAARPIDHEQVTELRRGSPKVIGLLPGSRKMEVQLNWPVMLDVIDQLSERHPDCHFLVANYRPAHREHCEHLLFESGKRLSIEFHVGKTSEIIAAADCCLMVSGSVSLELLAREKPAVVLYRGGYVMGMFAKLMVTCRFMTLPNLISGKMLYPEFPIMTRLHEHATKIARVLDDWLTHPQQRAAVQAEVQTLAREIARSQASQTTADYLLETLGSTAVEPASRAA